MEIIATPTDNAEKPHNQIEGLSDNQADEFVDLAYRNKALEEGIDPSDWTAEDRARMEIGANDARMSRLANLAMGKPELPPNPIPAGEIPKDDTRRKPTLVVNPHDGRIVEYGRMEHGSHPYGGMIVRR